MKYSISQLLGDVPGLEAEIKEDGAVRWEQVARLTAEKINAGRSKAPRRGRSAGRIAAALAAAALAAVLSVTAFAAGALDPLLDMLSVRFGGEPTQLELIEKLGTPLNVSDTVAGITVRAEAMICDGENAAVLYRVSREDGEPLIPADAPEGGKLVFGAAGGDGPLSWSSTFSNFSEAEPGCLSADYISFHQVEGELTENASYAFWANSLEYFYGEGALALSPRTANADNNDDCWELEIPLAAAPDMPTELAVNGESFTADGLTFTVTGARVSPLAVSVDYLVEGVLPAEGDDLTPYADGLSLTLMKKDGSVIDLSTGDDGFGNIHTNGRWIEEDRFRFGSFLPEIIPKEDMECIVFNGIKYPVK